MAHGIRIQEAHHANKKNIFSAPSLNANPSGVYSTKTIIIRVAIYLRVCPLFFQIDPSMRYSMLDTRFFSIFELILDQGARAPSTAL